MAEPFLLRTRYKKVMTATCALMVALISSAASPATTRHAIETAEGGGAAPSLREEYCGPDSLWFVLASLGHYETIDAVREKFPNAASSGGVSLLDLKCAAIQYGFNAYSVTLSASGMETLGRIYQQRNGDVQVILHVPRVWGHFVAAAWMNDQNIQCLEMNSFTTRNIPISRLSIAREKHISALIVSGAPLDGSELQLLSTLRTYNPWWVAGSFMAALMLGASLAWRHGQRSEGITI